MDDTEQLFLMAAVWTLVAVAIARFIPTWSGRIAFLVIAVGLPFWELPYGYHNFQTLCKEQGGLKIFEPILPQKMVCVAHPYDSGASELLKAGFGVVEARDRVRGVNRISRTPSGEFESVKQDQVTSEYCVTYAFVRGLPWRTMRNEMTISRDIDQRLIARHSDFIWLGMWWQQAATPVLGRGGECRRDAVSSISAALLGGFK